MNKQFRMVNGVKINTKIEWTDYTWNPIGGCPHGCRWQMPDGNMAVCYAETVSKAVKRQSGGKSYADGFEAHYWQPERLKEPLKVKTRSRIFLDSMSDLMSLNVTDDQIEQVLDICRQAHWHTFQLLTKNAPRLLKFAFPANVWVGASLPPTIFRGHKLSQHQQRAMLERTLKVLGKVQSPVRWMSFEPLSFDCASLAAQYPILQWAVIGAASDGRKTFQPESGIVSSLLEVLESQQVKVFFKGNLDWSPWRAEFPA